jgi:hypothetical protein
MFIIYSCFYTCDETTKDEWAIDERWKMNEEQRTKKRGALVVVLVVQVLLVVLMVLVVLVVLVLAVVLMVPPDASSVLSLWYHLGLRIQLQ